MSLSKENDAGGPGARTAMMEVLRGLTDREQALAIMRREARCGRDPITPTAPVEPQGGARP